MSGKQDIAKSSQKFQKSFAVLASEYWPTGNRRTDGWTSLRNIRMWERIENKESGREEL